MHNKPNKPVNTEALQQSIKQKGQVVKGNKLVKK